jgi:hypothetical protein
MNRRQRRQPSSFCREPIWIEAAESTEATEKSLRILFASVRLVGECEQERTKATKQEGGAKLDRARKEDRGNGGGGFYAEKDQNSSDGRGRS